ncbi:two-component system activity regulator YycH [Lentibacillus sp. N15]|uniref:YycH family regulatory protein n=1 Tax=Lentibacillus songyuanensis TaxID=3136161 RepID=UPI0031BAA497
MKLETVKSFTLAILIGISLLLTLGLWSYQPNYKFLANINYTEADIGGNGELHKKDVVEPATLVFHRYNRVYGFTDPKKQQHLYHDMQSWVMNNFKVSDANGPPEKDNQIELVFPDKLPMSMIDSLFTFNEQAQVDLPNWSFKRMFITFNDDSSLKVQFLSANEDKQASVLVNNSKKYNQLWSYVTKQNDLVEYISFDASDRPIYIPKYKPEMKQRKLTIRDINPGELVDILFSNPEIVRRETSNAGEVYYTDDLRGMRVKGNGKSIEFFNPSNKNYHQMEPNELLDKSMNNINEQKGWTAEFSLEELRPATNFTRFRMNYSGYPVFNNDLAVIEQELRNEDIYKYQRPLVSFNNQPGESVVELQSGEDVVYLLERSSFKTEDIDDIRVGYHLTADENASFYVTMEPAWYVKYNGSWVELTFDELSMDKGGS